VTHERRHEMSDYKFIKTETETIIHHVITCVICGRRVDELSEDGAWHVARETGRIMSEPNAGGLVWVCDYCRDDPQAARYE
jgi:hypothetical protein